MPTEPRSGKALWCQASDGTRVKCLAVRITVLGRAISRLRQHGAGEVADLIQFGDRMVDEGGGMWCQLCGTNDSMHHCWESDHPYYLRLVGCDAIAEHRRQLRALTNDEERSDMNMFLDLPEEERLDSFISAAFAEEAGVIIGWALADRYMEKRLFSVFVHPSRRGRGIGHALADVVFTAAMVKPKARLLSAWRSEFTEQESHG